MWQSCTVATSASRQSKGQRSCKPRVLPRCICLAYTLSAVLRTSHLHTTGGRNTSWSLPPGVARTLCFEAANQIVLNKAPIFITYVSHFPEFPFFAALRVRAQSGYDAWTLTPESQEIGIRPVNKERSEVTEKKWKWHVKREKLSSGPPLNVPSGKVYPHVS